MRKLSFTESEHYLIYPNFLCIVASHRFSQACRERCQKLRLGFSACKCSLPELWCFPYNKTISLWYLHLFSLLGARHFTHSLMKWWIFCQYYNIFPRTSAVERPEWSIIMFYYWVSWFIAAMEYSSYGAAMEQLIHAKWIKGSDEQLFIGGICCSK